MKDRLLRKLLIEQGVIRKDVHYQYLGNTIHTIANEFRTPGDYIKWLQIDVRRLKNTVDLLLEHLGLEAFDVPFKEAQRILRKKKK